MYEGLLPQCEVIEVDVNVPSDEPNCEIATLQYNGLLSRQLRDLVTNLKLP